jgi:tripartite-type tricarboxylate transporter receptor subunit TctC
LHYGIVAPAGTPPAIVATLNTALNEALADNDVRNRLAVDGVETQSSTPAEYAADIDREETKWSAILKKSGGIAE